MKNFWSEEEFHTTVVWRIMRLCLLMRLGPSQRRTHGQGVDQSTSPPQGVTQGGERKRSRRSLREIGKESLIIIVTVSHTLATQRHHQSGIGPGRLAGDTLPLRPSIHLSLFHLTPTYTSMFFSLIRSRLFCFISAEGIFVMLSSSPLSITAILCQSSHTGAVPRLWDAVFCILAQSPS